MSFIKFFMTIIVLITVPSNAFHFKINEGYGGLFPCQWKYQDKILMPGEAGFIIFIKKIEKKI